jgi:biopolymer transport protein ExbB
MNGTSESLIQKQLLDLFLFFGSEWVLHLLLLLSVVSVAITLERIYHFWTYCRSSKDLPQQINAQLAQSNIEGARSLLQNDPSHVAFVGLQGLEGFHRGSAAVEELMAAATKSARGKMERGLAFLGTLGNNAPFVGLFGTVLGIIRAFRDLSENTMEGSAAVMAGIAEALIATAVGLLVALPAVAIFNLFQRYIKAQTTQSDAVGHVLLAYLKTPKS